MDSCTPFSRGHALAARRRGANEGRLFMNTGVYR